MVMKKKVYTEEQVNQMKGLLNGINATGIQNAKQIVAISNILESGVSAEVPDSAGKKEGKR